MWFEVCQCDWFSSKLKYQDDAMRAMFYQETGQEKWPARMAGNTDSDYARFCMEANWVLRAKRIRPEGEE